MNEELLQLIYSRLDTKASYEQFKKDFSATPDLQKLGYSKLNTTATFEQFLKDIGVKNTSEPPKKQSAEADTESLSVSAKGNSLSDSKGNENTAEYQIETPSPKVLPDNNGKSIQAGAGAVVTPNSENYQEYTDNRYTVDVADSYNVKSDKIKLSASDIKKQDVQNVEQKLTNPNGYEAYQVAFGVGNLFTDKDAFAYELSIYGGNSSIDDTTLSYNQDFLAAKTKENLAVMPTSTERKSDWLNRNSHINLVTGQPELNSYIPENDTEPIDVNGKDPVLGIGVRTMQEYHGDKLKGIDVENLSYYMRVSGKEKAFQEKGIIGQSDAVNSEEDTVNILKEYTQWKNDAELKDSAILKSRADILSYKIDSGNATQQDIDAYNVIAENINIHLKNVNNNEINLTENVIPVFQNYAKDQKERKEEKQNYWDMKQRLNSGNWTTGDVLSAVGYTAENIYNNVRNTTYDVISNGGQLLYDNAKYFSVPYQLMSDEEKEKADRTVNEFTDLIYNRQEEVFNAITKDIEMMAPVENYDYEGKKVTLKDGLFFDEVGNRIEIKEPDKLKKTGESKSFDLLGVLPEASTQITLMAGTALSGTYAPYLAYGYKQTKQDFMNAFPDATDFEASSYALLTNGIEALTERISPDKKMLGINSGNKVINVLKGVGRESRLEATKAAGKEFLHNFIAENIEEITALPLQKGLNILSNYYKGDKKLQESISNGELGETILATSATFPFMGLGGIVSEYNQSRTNLTESDLLLSAVRSDGAYQKIQGWLNDKNLKNIVPESKINDFKTKLDEIIKYKDKIPENFNYDDFEKAKGFIQEKEALTEKKKELDPAFHDEINKQIAAVDEKIKSIRTTKQDSSQSEMDIKKPDGEKSVSTWVDLDGKIKSNSTDSKLSDKSSSLIENIESGKSTIEEEIQTQQELLDGYLDIYGEESPQVINQKAVVDELIQYKESAVNTSNQDLEVRLVDGKPVVKNTKGNRVNERAERKAIREAAQNGLYDDVPRALDNAPQFNSAEEVSNYIAENSENPVEVAQEIKTIQESNQGQELTLGDYLLPHIRQGVYEKSFNEHSDKNNVTPSIRKSYFGKSGRSLDVIAQEVESEMYGDYNANEPRITEEDIVNFILENPSVSEYESQNKTNEQIALEERFVELTGIPASRESINAFAGKQSSQKEVKKEERVSSNAEMGFEDFPFSIAENTKGLNSNNKEKATKEKIQKKYPDAKVVQSEKELPQPIQREIRNHKAEGKIRGVFYNGEVYMVADNIPTMGNAEGTYRHERIGHKGVVDYLGKALSEYAIMLVDDAKGGRLKTLQDLAKRYGLPTDLTRLNQSQKRELGEELIAHIAENSNKYPKAWTDLLAFIRKTLRDFGVDLQISDDEIRWLLNKVEERVNTKNKDGKSQLQNELIKAGALQKLIEAVPDDTLLRESFITDNKRILESLIGLAGNYSINENTIRIGRFYSSLFGGRNKVLIHEAVHAATIKTYQDVLSNPDKYTTNQVEAVRELNGIAWEYLENTSALAKMSFPTLYGTTDPYEFIAEFVSNKDFRGWVSKNPPDKKTGVLNYIWNKILTILGAKKSQINNDLVSKIDKKIDALFDAQIKNKSLVESNNARYSLLDESDINAVGTIKESALKNIELERKSIKEKAIAEGTFMKAPNGKPTNLNEQQWIDVRTKRFTDWFGDWQNDPENASKVVDENGEPMVVYHGTNSEFNTFEQQGNPNGSFLGEGFYFTSNKKYAEKFSKKGKIVSAFINARKGESIDGLSEEERTIFLNSEDLSEQGYDYKQVGDNYRVNNPNQIKSATDNTGLYSEDSNDIRFKLSTSTPKTISDLSVSPILKFASILDKSNFSAKEIRQLSKDEKREEAKKAKKAAVQWLKRIKNNTIKASGNLGYEIAEVVRGKDRNESVWKDALGNEARVFRGTLREIFKGNPEKLNVKYKELINDYLSGKSTMLDFLMPKSGWFNKDGKISPEDYNLLQRLVFDYQKTGKADTSGLTEKQKKSFKMFTERMDMLNGFRAKIDGLSNDVINVLSKKIDDYDRKLTLTKLSDSQKDSIELRLSGKRKAGNFSGENKGVLKDLISMLTEAGYTAGTAMKYAQLLISRRKTQDLIRTINDNMGKYMTRSYEAFNNNEYIKSLNNPYKELSPAKKKKIDKAVDYLISTGEYADRKDAQREINEYIKSLANSQKGDFWVHSIGGRATSNFLKERQTLPKEIRELLGEEKDPLKNYVNTVFGISRYLGNLSYQSKLRDTLLSSGIGKLSTDENLDTGYVSLVPDTNDWGLLSGIDVPAEFKRELDKFTNDQFGDFPGWLYSIVSWVKMNKTVYAPSTALRNLYNGFFLGMRTGHPAFFGFKDTAIGFNQSVGNKKSYTDSQLRDELLREEIIGGSTNVGEMRKYMSDFSRESKDITKKRTGLGAVKQFAQRFYRFGDDFYRVTAYLGEKESLIKSGVPEELAIKMAGKRIREMYPTYSILPPNVVKLRVFPFAGSFLSFHYTNTSSSVATLKTIREDFQDGRKSMAYKRAAWWFVSNSAIYGAEAVSKSLILGSGAVLTNLVFGLFDDDDDEKEDAIRSLSSDFYKNSSYVYVGNEGGVPQFIDGSFISPSEPYLKPLAIALGGRSDYDSFKDALSASVIEYFKPYFGMDVATNAAGSLVFNTDEYGDKIWREGRFIDDLGKTSVYTARAVAPGVFNNMIEFARANEVDPDLFGNKTTSSREYNNFDALISTLGVRVVTFNPKAGLDSYAYQLSGKNRNVQSEDLNKMIKRSVVLSPNRVKEIVDDYEKQKTKISNEIKKTVDASLLLGITDREIAARFTGSGRMSKSDWIYFNKTGKLPLKPVSEISASNYIEYINSVSLDKLKNKQLSAYQKNLISVNLEIIKRSVSDYEEVLNKLHKEGGIDDSQYKNQLNKINKQKAKLGM